MKQTSLRSKVEFKILCTVLCCLLFGACIGLSGLAAHVWYHYGSSGSYAGIAGSTATSEYQDDAWNLFILDQRKEDLTYLGKQDYKNLSQSLHAARTNFRYRILTMNGKELMSNLEDRSITKQVSKVYDTVYSSNNSNYTDYNETYSQPGKNDDPTFQGTITYNQDYIRSKAKTFTIKDGIRPTEYVLEWGIATNLTAKDSLLDFQQHAKRYSVLLLPFTMAAIVCGLLWLAFFLWLLAAAGHRESMDGITLSRFQQCPYDLLLVIELLLCTLYLTGSIQIIDTLFSPFPQYAGRFRILFGVLGGLAAGGMALGLPACITLAAQLKDRSCLRRSLSYRIFRRLGLLLREIPINGRAFCSACGFLLLYALLCFLAGNDSSVLSLMLAVLMAAAMILALLWWLKGWHSIRKGGKALAAGDLHYVTDTRHIPWDLKKHGEDLNAISKGMQTAVDQQMRSDRFRTELITNVSHDLKTPITSIINYVDLLQKLNLDNATAQSYLEVLERKSQRLKTLTEDLVEASKASAGVLPVNLQRLEASQLVEQALGEYEEKLAAAQLQAVTRLPKEGAWIRADGRHLWRILDNLLSNCAKYAMPNTRVYVDVIRQDGQVTISVKNISADPLNMPAEELLQRFVRGEDSRTSEGSGLGLSIAQSLATLQGAKFQLQVDGDLFKANVIFPDLK